MWYFAEIFSIFQDAKDPFEKAVLDGRQLALKVTFYAPYFFHGWIQLSFGNIIVYQGLALDVLIFR